MPYVEGQTIHDADSHVMELPGTIKRLHRAEVPRTRSRAGGAKAMLPELVRRRSRAMQDDPEFRAGDEANLLAAQELPGAGRLPPEDRPKALDHFGFASQLVFTTACLSNFGLEQMGEVELAIAAARAHNRMMTEFCSVDRRLLATGYVPLIDRARAPEIAREAIALGCQGAGDPVAPSAGLLAQPHRARAALGAGAGGAACRSCSTSAARRRWPRLPGERPALREGLPRRRRELHLADLHDHPAHRSGRRCRRW